MKNKKIAITGHTRGIGKCLYDLFVQNGYDITGFSRSNGHDISEEHFFDKIVDYDIFINNAAEYDFDHQSRLLYESVERWQSPEKLIVNVCSKSALLKPNFYKFEHYQKYCQEKTNQSAFCMHRMFFTEPKILNVLLGMVDTDMTKDIVTAKELTDFLPENYEMKKMSPENAAKVIYETILLQEYAYIQEIIVENHSI